MHLAASLSWNILSLLSIEDYEAALLFQGHYPIATNDP